MTTIKNNENTNAGQLVDLLYLDMLHLIEAHTQSRVNIERTNSSGAILLARTKYQQGGNTLTIAQIPTENSAEFHALCRVVSLNKDSEVNIERHNIDKGNGYVDPLHWFSVLPPSSLRNAATKFKDCIELVTESTNLQRELSAVISFIAKLRKSLTQS